MYGIQASIVGRRSFGGFNAAAEEAWKNSKAVANSERDDNNNNTKQERISDEELLQRYQDIVNQRSEAASASRRPIGNLKSKRKGPK